MAVGSSWPKGGSSGRTLGAAAPCPRPSALPLLQWLLAIAHTPSRSVLRTINTESPGLSSPHPHTLHFHSLSLAPLLANLFSTNLECKETLQRIPKLITTKPSSRVVRFVFTNVTLFVSFVVVFFTMGKFGRKLTGAFKKAMGASSSRS